MSRLPEVELRGKVAPWQGFEWVILALLMLAGFWLRARGLSQVGFGDDEIHKWFAGNRYLHGDFGGDDVEHPMVMKWLIALFIKVGEKLHWAPETMVRAPNVLAGTASIWAVAQLGRRAFGKLAGLWAAGLAAFSTTLIGYQRIGKEDTLLGLFLILVLWCAAEAKASADDEDPRAQRRWQYLGAAFLGAMMASKYFFFILPIPVVFYLSVLPQTRGRIPLREWAVLVAVSLAVFFALNWSPFLPSTWAYARSYLGYKQTVHGSLFFMGRIFPNLPAGPFYGTPPWFYVVFAAVKLSPVTVVTAAGGLALAIWYRRPAHRLLLSWVGGWFFIVSVLMSFKWGRYFIAVLPAFFVLSGYFAAEVLNWWSARRASARTQPGTNAAIARAPSFAAVLVTALLLWGAEAQASLRLAPHYRMYVNAFGGGDRNFDWFFPHCDYFDAGFREALAYTAAHAEPNAELSTEVDWLARYYAERFGRLDLSQTLVRPGESCLGDRMCYVVVQTGRYYFVNKKAVDNLSRLEPWHVESIRGHEVVKVYRLSPGQSPFADKTLARTGVSP